MTKPLISSLLILVSTLASAGALGGQEVEVKRLTSLLVVEKVEPSLEFWVERLGFEVADEVPGEGGLAFVILKRPGIELMLQSRASVAADIPAIAEASGPSSLYIEVEDLAAIERALEGVDLVFPRRTTFYGATEIGVRDPGGHWLVFAQFGDD
ncbi:MAG: VOC family protein [Acidobacteriota bacterium]